MLSNITNFLKEKFNKNSYPLSAVQKRAFSLLREQNYEGFYQHFNKFNINSNLTDARGITLLMAAVCETIDHQEEGITLTKFLLSEGAEIKTVDSNGRSAFLMACHWNLKGVAKILLEHSYKTNNKIDINQTTFQNNGLTLNPLFCSLLKENYDLAFFLLEHGANPDIVIQLNRESYVFTLSEENLKFLKDYQNLQDRIDKRVQLHKIRLLQLNYRLNSKTQDSNKSVILTKLHESHFKQGVLQFL